jgi:hypothetical protein
MELLLAQRKEVMTDETELSSADRQGIGRET